MNGTFSGFGTLVSAEGTYSGEFRNGKFEGQGVFLEADGNRYTGGWHKGLMHGNGRLISPDGLEFVGNFSNGLPFEGANQGTAQAPQAPASDPPVAQPARKVAEKTQPAPLQPEKLPAKAAPSKVPAGGAALIPSGEWDCSTGYYPYTSYSSLVTSGNSYTTSWRDGSGASKGTYSRGSSSIAYGGISIAWDSGTWSSFKGEFIPAGSVDPRTGKAAAQDSVNVGVDSSYWSTSCYPKQAVRFV